jgi:hypothetical protein
MKDYQPTLEEATQELTEDGVDIKAFLLRVQAAVDEVKAKSACLTTTLPK